MQWAPHQLPPRIQWDRFRRHRRHYGPVRSLRRRGNPVSWTGSEEGNKSSSLLTQDAPSVQWGCNEASGFRLRRRRKLKEGYLSVMRELPGPSVVDGEGQPIRIEANPC